MQSHSYIDSKVKKWSKILSDKDLLITLTQKLNYVDTEKFRDDCSELNKTSSLGKVIEYQ